MQLISHISLAKLLCATSIANAAPEIRPIDWLTRQQSKGSIHLQRSVFYVMHNINNFSGRKLFLVLMAAFLAACSSVGKIQKQHDGSYVLRKVDHKGIFGSMGSLKDETNQEVDDFAIREGKKVIPLSEREHPIGVAGDWAWYEIQFRLGDPQADAARFEACLASIKKSPSLQIIANKMSLGGVKEQSFSMLANRDKATDAEKPAISLYADMRKICVDQEVKSRQEAGVSQSALNVTQSSMAAMDNALVALYNGSITYGDYAKFRKEVYDNEMIAIAKINEELRRDALDARARAEQLANQSRIAQAQMWQAFSSQQAATAMMIQATKPAISAPPQRLQANCRSSSLGLSVNTVCD